MVDPNSSSRYRYYPYPEYQGMVETPGPSSSRMELPMLPQIRPIVGPSHFGTFAPPPQFPLGMPGPSRVEAFIPLAQFPMGIPGPSNLTHQFDLASAGENRPPSHPAYERHVTQASSSSALGALSCLIVRK